MTIVRAGLFAALAVLAAVVPPHPAAAASPSWATTPPFEVTVSLSPKAAARLAHPRETIIVAAYVYGDANAKGERLADEVGQIDFGPEQKIELPGAGTARLAGTRYDRNKLAYVDGKLQVLVNVFSGRRSSPDNLLECGLFQDAVDIAARATIAVRCKLIGEP